MERLNSLSKSFVIAMGEETALDQLNTSVLHKDDPNNKILVRFFGPVIKLNNTRSLKLVKEGCSRMILIIDNEMTSSTAKTLELLPFLVERFQVTELLVNITKHELQPKHQLLTTKEKQRLLEKYSIQEEQSFSAPAYIEERSTCSIVCV